MTDMAAPRRARWLIALLVAIFAAPPVVSWVLFRYTDVGRDAAPHGQLIQPPRPLADAGLEGGAPGGRLHGRWTLFHLAPDDCPVSCTEALYRMQQVRLAMSTNAERVQRVLAFSSAAAPVARLGEEWPGQAFITGFAQLDAFRLSPDEDPIAAARLYLVDPRGFLMMSYAPDADPKGIISDLKRLVRYARSGG